MHLTAQMIGLRIRNYRLQLGLSQEKLAELAGFHPTYIGQLERGEKNATIESVAKIAAALHVPLSRLFEKLDRDETDSENIPLYCYELLSSKSKSEQRRLYRILKEVEQYKYD